MTASSWRWFDKYIPIPRSRIRVAKELHAWRPIIDEAFASVIAGSARTYLHIAAASPDERERVQNLIDKFTPDGPLSFVEHSVGHGKQSLSVLAYRVSDRQSKDLQTQIQEICGHLAEQLGTMVIGKAKSCSRAEYCRFLKANFVQGMAAGSLRVRDRATAWIFSALKISRDKAYIRCSPDVGMAQDALNEAFSWFINSDRAFQIDVSLRESFPGVDLEGMINADADQPASSKDQRLAVLQATKRVVWVDIRQILLPNQSEIVLTQGVYREALLQRLPDHLKDTFVIIADQDVVETVGACRLRILSPYLLAMMCFLVLIALFAYADPAIEMGYLP